jgi:hypothetical protein
VLKFPASLHKAFYEAEGRKTLSREEGDTVADFFMGVHAAIAEMQFLTEDDRRYRIYFPAANIIGPNK